eukprot:CAMPEP_0174758042 /NCGR_PEP_ID=MMETSP1094-20130205/107565_1 /TAXON_ID=156173 /ORGANISM="Chrysochromulina brevifilum, Strain UTEX LB 985" /LENGTH=85 /DNA_ID=CAMNT_0015963965 /DNA_START=1330 /DNA_END=1587 /DNA_ORIENTATION=+
MRIHPPHLPDHLIKSFLAAVQRAGHAALIDRQPVRAAVKLKGRVGDAVGHAASDRTKVGRGAVRVAGLVIEAKHNIAQFAITIRD